METKIYKFKSFAKWAKNERLKDPQLKKALEEIENGSFEADLGCGLIKKRIARKGEGKRGGYRCILAFKKHDKVIFLFGFQKSELANINDQQLKFLKNLAREYLKLNSENINALIKKGILIEVK